MCSEKCLCALPFMPTSCVKRSERECGEENKQLKKRIVKLEEGDREAIPEIFEGILEKLLSGKLEEAHNELRKEIIGKEAKSSEDDDTEDEESDFDEEDMIEADHEEEAKGKRR
ncbi:kinesin-like protein KIF21A [Senna tora]|uniref:Kinesin-like protein KIF21A n=1 Tax=Senna tora TaxID=362788 RepID=A0A834SX85_9FABA|nr:kinesin-like protein KIF21A [Senna tora]